jgi:hypothetical protein
MVGRLEVEVATCPNCGGFLRDRHRCHLWPLRLHVFGDLLLGGVAGGLPTLVAFYLLYGRVSWLAIALAAGAGMIVTRAWLIGEPRRVRVETQN